MIYIFCLYEFVFIFIYEINAFETHPFDFLYINNIEYNL